MSFELVIFLIVAAVAIFAAAFMLVSRNAVHSALFLVINMICLAFFYLLLNAPFLAMVQITVYAGAIMVLFMFVIMLLGGEQLGTMPTRYRWLPTAGVALTTLFLLTSFVAVVQGNVGLLKPIVQPPRLRVVDVAPDKLPLTVYLNDTKLADSVAYATHTDYTEVAAGNYNVAVFAAKADGSLIDPAKDKPYLQVPLSLTADTSTTLIATTDRLLIAPQNLSVTADEKQLRYTAINALPGSAPVNLLKVNPSDVKDVQNIAPNLAYGDVSKTATLPADSYNLAWEMNGQRILSLNDVTLGAQTHQLLILAPQLVTGSTTAVPASVVVTEPTALDFGSPQQIGNRLFSVYLLPFELVSLLLLAAMVGAIILTRDEMIRRDRTRVVFTPPVRRVPAPVVSVPTPVLTPGMTANSIAPEASSAD